MLFMELSDGQALACYGAGGIMAFISYFSRPIMILCWTLLGMTAVYLTVVGE